MGNDAFISSTASKTPPQRSCSRTARPSKTRGFCAAFGLMQRMKCDSTFVRSAIRWVRSPMKRRPIELNVADRPLPTDDARPVSNSLASSGSAASSSADESSVGRQSLFRSSHEPDSRSYRTSPAKWATTNPSVGRLRALPIGLRNSDPFCDSFTASQKRPSVAPGVLHAASSSRSTPLGIFSIRSMHPCAAVGGRGRVRGREGRVEEGGRGWGGRGVWRASRRRGAPGCRRSR